MPKAMPITLGINSAELTVHAMEEADIFAGHRCRELMSAPVVHSLFGLSLEAVNVCRSFASVECKFALEVVVAHRSSLIQPEKLTQSSQVESQPPHRLLESLVLHQPSPAPHRGLRIPS